MNNYNNILIIQTAYAGDVILTLPMVQVLKKSYPEAEISFLCIPSTKNLVENSIFIKEIIVYDKRGKQKGLFKFLNLIKEIKNSKYDLIISPHRSLRSTLISYLSKVKETVSFDESSFSFLYKHKVEYISNIHEILRNLSLLNPLGIKEKEIIAPELFISNEDEIVVNKILEKFNIGDEKFITIAPGTVWNTKMYPEEKISKLVKLINESNIKIVMIGGEEDAGLCGMIIFLSKCKNVFNAAGKLSLLQSAELIRRSNLLITNDSAPLHLANAVGTKVIAIFGATIPEFGFYPFREGDKIIQTMGLKCRPCGIHGGYKCPIKTFDCMNKIQEVDILEEVLRSI